MAHFIGTLLLMIVLIGKGGGSIILPQPFIDQQPIEPQFISTDTADGGFGDGGGIGSLLMMALPLLLLAALLGGSRPLINLPPVVITVPLPTTTATTGTTTTIPTSTTTTATSTTTRLG